MSAMHSAGKSFGSINIEALPSHDVPTGLVYPRAEKGHTRVALARAPSSYGKAHDVVSSLEEQQQKQHVGSRSCFQNGLTRENWFPEMLAMVFAVAVIVVIVVVLKIHERRPVDEWTSGWTRHVTLNAFIGFFISILYLFLLSPISSCISQLKWNHFKSERPLIDFERFDNASRGAMGATMLIFSRTRMSAVHVAALLMLAIQTIGPLTQQIVVVESFPFPSQDTADSPWAWDFNQTQQARPLDRAFSPNNQDSSGPYTAWAQGLRNDIVPSFMAGLFSATEEDYFVRNTCQNGQNCSWDPFATVKAYSQCANLTDQLQIPTNFDYTARPTLKLSDEIGLPLTGEKFTGNQTIVGIMPGQTSLAFKNETGVFLDLMMIYYEQAPGDGEMTTGKVVPIKFGKVAAWECILQFVTQPLVAESFGNKYVEHAIAEPIRFTAPEGSSGNVRDRLLMQSQGPDYVPVIANGKAALKPRNTTSSQASPKSCAVSYPCSFENCPAAPHSSKTFWASDIDACDLTNFKKPIMHLQNETYAYDPATAALLAQQLFPKFNGSYITEGWASAGNTGPSDDANALSSSGAMNSDILTKLYTSMASEVNSTTNGGTMSALSLSQVFNNTAKSLTKYMRESDPERCIGGTSTYRNAYIIRWQWISVPVFLFFISFCLLAYTIFDTKRKGMTLWRQSSLAAMTRGVVLTDRRGVAEHETVSDLHRLATSMPTRLDMKTGLLVSERGKEAGEV